MTRSTRATAYGWLVGGVTLGLGLTLLAPYAVGRGWVVGPLLYDLFHRVCHQLPERSFHAFGAPLAVCHRCFGLYSGVLVGLLAWPWLDRLRTPFERTPRLVLLFFVPLLVDWLWPANNYLTRYLTGLVAALPVGLLLWWAVAELFDSMSSTVRGEA